MSRRSEIAGCIVVLVCVSGNACNGGGGGSNGGGCGGGGQTIPDECMLNFTNANDYSYTADLTLASTDMTACTDGTIDWSQLTVDYRGRPVDPTDVDKVTIGKIDMDQTTLLQAIDENTLKEQDIITYGEIDTTGQTSAQLTEFSVIGNFFVPSDPSNQGFCEDAASTWLATAWVLNDRNVYEILSSMIIVPVADSENTSASFTNDSATLDFTVDLESLTPLTADSTCEDYGLDWSAVTTDVNGAELDPLFADTLRIAHLPGTLADAEANFLQLDVAADQTYYLTSYGLTSIPGDSNPDQTLFQATSTDGQTFSGFTDSGVWIVDLECTADSCLSPAPLILSTVEVK